MIKSFSYGIYFLRIYLGGIWSFFEILQTDWWVEKIGMIFSKLLIGCPMAIFGPLMWGLFHSTHSNHWILSIFNQKMTRTLTTKLGPYASLKTQWDLNWEPSDSIVRPQIIKLLSVFLSPASLKLQYSPNKLKLQYSYSTKRITQIVQVSNNKEINFLRQIELHKHLPNFNFNYDGVVFTNVPEAVWDYIVFTLKDVEMCCVLCMCVCVCVCLFPFLL